MIDLVDEVGAAFELGGDAFRIGDLFLIFDLVLKSGPKFHGDGAELDLNRNVFTSLGKIDRDGDNEMQTAVAVLLGMGDVVFFDVDGDVFLSFDHICEGVDVIEEGADDARTGNIGERFLDAFDGDGLAAAMHFFNDAVSRFETGGDGFDGVAVVTQIELAVESVELGLDDLEGCAVFQHHVLKGFRLSECFDGIFPLIDDLFSRQGGDDLFIFRMGAHRALTPLFAVG